MRRILVAALAVAGVLAPATAASADTPKPPESIGVRLLDAPTDRRNDPRALAYVIDHVAPGATIQRRIEVSNTTSKPADISVYPAAASIVGGVFTGADGNTPNELSTWTSVDRGTVPLAPGAKQPVTVVLRVPKDAAPGEQYAVVWASVSSAPAATDNVTAPVAAPPAPDSTVPWVPIVVGVGLLLLLLLLWFLLARRRSRDSEGRHSGRPEQPLKPA